MVGVVAELSVDSSAFVPRRRERMISSACCLSVGTPVKYILKIKVKIMHRNTFCS